jgi:hypothetical protein
MGVIGGPLFRLGYIVWSLVSMYRTFSWCVYFELVL